jgi:GNAT superfamily N-acetyltransferase
MKQDYAGAIQASQVTIAEVEGELAGVLVLSETNEGFLVESVSVHPSHQGHGIGKQLLAQAEQAARTRNYATIYLYTNEKMVSNIALYQRAGYAEYERRTEGGFNRVFMRKVLG